MTAPTPEQWNVVRNGEVNSTWPNKAAADMHAHYMNSMLIADEFTVEVER